MSGRRKRKVVERMEVVGEGDSEFGLGMELVNPDKESGEEEGETGNLKGRGWTFHATSGRDCE